MPIHDVAATRRHLADECDAESERLRPVLAEVQDEAISATARRQPKMCALDSVGCESAPWTRITQ
jgi:hypothetical protein